jgi:hypothetical protein
MSKISKRPTLRMPTVHEDEAITADTGLRLCGYFGLDSSIMTKYLIFGLVALLCGSTYADAVYKWTDENGKVHYGGATESARNSTNRTAVSVADAPPEPAGGSTTAREGIPRKSGSPIPAENASLQTCLTMARAMVDKKNPTPPAIRADSRKLLDLCPQTAYECVTYIERPERNSCSAVPMKANGNITNNRTYTR